jgi:UDP-N-acetylmuramate--alanine ligase
MLKKFNKIHIVGIGGISLSAIAIILKNQGFEITGTDAHLSSMTKMLEDKYKIKIKKNHSAKDVTNCDALVYTSAIGENDKDFLLAKKLGKPTFSRAQILGMISEGKQTISVSGSHGKTTASAMIAYMLSKAGLSPTAHIGGIVENFGSNVLFGESDIFVTEACEYKDSFLQLKNDISIVLNLSPDHLDYFKTFENYIASFEKFVKNTKKNGVFITNYDDANCKKLKFSNTMTFAINSKADVTAQNIQMFENGKFMFDAFYLGRKMGRVKLGIMGWHNIYNALASICVGIKYQVPFEKIQLALETFKGVERRNQIILENKNLLILHDYAHHPDEIKSTLRAYKNLGGKLITIFQPHTFTRTRDLFGEFISSFDESDEVWLLPIYPAREKPIKDITSYNLAKSLKKHGKKVKYFSNFEKCRQSINLTPQEKTVYAILGAGDIVELCKDL